jgi:hypothetical protein
MARTSAYKAKYEKAKAALRRGAGHARAYGGKIKPFAIAGGAGGAAYYGQKMLAEKVDFFKNNWYAPPLAILGASYVVAKKNPTAGHGLAGAAGYALAQAWDLKDYRPNVPATKDLANAKGMDDASALIDPPRMEVADVPDTGAFIDDAGAPEDYQLRAGRVADHPHPRTRS